MTMPPNKALQSSPSTRLLEIPLAKGTVVLRTIIGFVFFYGGYEMWRSSPYPVLGGFVAVFSACGIYFGLRLLVDKRPGLVLSKAGLEINKKIGFGGTIPWEEITDFSLIRYGHDYQLVVKVKRPDAYIARGNVVIRWLNSLSSGVFGSPIRVTAGLLKYNSNKLLSTAIEFRTQYGSAK